MTGRAALLLAVVALALLAALLPAGPAAARERSCTTVIDGADVALTYDTEDPVWRANRSLRERLVGGYGRISCPGYVTLRHLTPGMDDPSRAVFCLAYDEQAGRYRGLSVGPRDAWLSCRTPARSLCTRLSENRDTAVALATMGTAVATGGLAAGADAALAAGVTALSAEGGALVLEGEKGFLRSALGTLGSTAVQVIGAPDRLTRSAVSLVVTGSMIYACGS